MWEDNTEKKDILDDEKITKPNDNFLVEVTWPSWKQVSNPRWLSGV